MFAEMLEQPHLNHSCVIMSGLDCTKIAERVHSAHNSSKIRMDNLTLDSRLPQDLDGPTTQYSVGKYLPLDVMLNACVCNVWNVWNLRIQKIPFPERFKLSSVEGLGSGEHYSKWQKFQDFPPVKSLRENDQSNGSFLG